MNVAVDAMGGDNAPEMVVQGAVKAASELGIDVTLVGDRDVVTKQLGSRFPANHITLYHSEQVERRD